MALDKRRIVLVDDDDDILQSLRKSLDRAGLEVHAFNNPIEALKHIETDCKDYGVLVLVTDVKMSQMSGFLLARKVNKLRPDIKIVLMTAFELNLSEFQSMFPNSPVDIVLRKPFLPSKLVEMINEL